MIVDGARWFWSYRRIAAKALPVVTVKNGPGVLDGRSSVTPPAPAEHWRIMRRSFVTKRAGARPLWEGFVGDATGERSSEQVGVHPAFGRFYSWLVAETNAGVVVEIGTAFGASGMYLLSGIERAGQGRLVTFEPNEDWRRLAQRNLAAISGSYLSVAGTFEDNVAAVDGQIDLALIDAIHTSDFVEPQLELVLERLAPGGVVILDDIDFSPDMRSCWDRIVAREGVMYAAEVGGHLGVIQMR